MRWIVYVVAGWVVLTFLIGVVVGHLITRRPRVLRRMQEPLGVDEDAAAEARARRSA